MKRKSNSKPKTKKELYIHFSRRLQERYNLDITESEWTTLAKEIRDQKHTFLFKQSHTRTHYEVLFKNKKFYVIYNNKVHGLVTVLPEPNSKESEEYAKKKAYSI